MKNFLVNRGVVALCVAFVTCFGAYANGLEDTTEYSPLTIGDKEMILSQRWAVALSQSDNGDYAGAFAVTDDVVYVLDASNGGKKLDRYNVATGESLGSLSIVYGDGITDPELDLSQVGVDDDGTLFISYKSTYTGYAPVMYLDIVDKSTGAVTERKTYQLKDMRNDTEEFKSYGFSQPRVIGSLASGDYTVSLMEKGGELVASNETYAGTAPEQTISLGFYTYSAGVLVKSMHPGLEGLSPDDNFSGFPTPQSTSNRDWIYIVDAHGKQACTYRLINESVKSLECFDDEISGGNGLCFFELNGQQLLVQGISCGTEVSRWRLSAWPSECAGSYKLIGTDDFHKLVDFPASEVGLGTSLANNPATLCQARQVSDKGEIFLYSPGSGLACYDLKEEGQEPVTPPSGGGGNLDDDTQYSNLVIGQKNTTFGQRWVVDLSEGDNGEYAGAFAVSGEVVYVLDASNGGRSLVRYNADNGAELTPLTVTYPDGISDPGLTLSQVGVDDDGTLFVSYKSTSTTNDPWLYLDLVDTTSGVISQRMSYQLKNIRAYPENTFTSCGFSTPRVEGSLLGGNYTISMLENGGELLENSTQTYANVTAAETLSLCHYQFVNGASVNSYNPALMGLSPSDNYSAFPTPHSLVENKRVYLVDAYGKRAMIFRSANDDSTAAEYFGSSADEEGEDGYEDLSGGNGSCHFTLNGQTLVVQGISCGTTAARWRLSTWPLELATNNKAFSSADYQKLVDFPASEAGLGTSTVSNPATLCQARVVNGVGEVYIYSPGSGLARYDLGEPMSNSALWPVAETCPLLAVNCHSVTLSEACLIQVMTLDGRIAWSCSSEAGVVILPASLRGFHIIQARSLSSGHTQATKAIL
ncbi:MAG: hypothetical protein LUC85_07515 [Bacteroidales bacterium]|nr:hypothetical protein [Bacteroidales bacterium]MCD8394664.1 hypothetical protein [Bacteroidales bacterium]